MHELTLSPMYGVLLSNYLNKVSPKPLSLDSNLSLRDINDDSAYTKRISQAEIEQLIQAIYEVTRDLSFGLEIGQSLHPSDYGTVGYALMNCSTLFQVFDFASQYKHCSNNGFEVSFTKQGSFYHFKIDNRVESEWMKVILELDFVSSLSLSKFFVGPDKQKLVVPHCVRFQHAALCSAQKYEAIFGCEVMFNQTVNEIVFFKEVFDLPIRSANPKLFRILQAKLAAKEQAMQQQTSLKSKVAHYVLANIQDALPSITDVAEHFNMSVSTFKKHLSNEASNYTKILDEVRQNAALQLISKPEHSIDYIAKHLQFSNVSTFTRAFKRWTNMSPARYRKSLETEKPG